MKTTATSLMFFISMIVAFSQAQPPKRNIKVGDHISQDHKFTNLVNYSSNEAKISDFKKDLLILDFWSTGCASCIESWPRLQNLQNQYKDNIQILLINCWQDEKTVKLLIEKRRKNNIVNLTLPSACKDENPLNELFNVKSVPHAVWIDKNGIVLSITTGEAINQTSIDNYLNNKKIIASQKEELVTTVDYTKPIFTQENAPTPNTYTKWQSTLTGYIDGLVSTFGCYEKNEMAPFITMINHPLIDLYRYAFSDQHDSDGMLTRIESSRVQIEVRDSTKFTTQKNNERILTNYYTYQLITGRETTEKDLQKMMQQDLNRYFNTTAQWEKRAKKCLIMSIKDTSEIRYENGPKVFRISDVELEINGHPINRLISFLKESTPYYNSPYPIIDETNFKGKLRNIKIEGNIYNHEKLNKELNKYGITFTLQERKLDILVLKDQLLIPNRHHPQQ